MSQIQYIQKHPSTFIASLGLFTLLVSCGVALCLYFENIELQALEEEALALAEETGLFFSNQLDRAVLPLFSLAQFVRELPIFQDLEKEIGYVGEPNALPLLESGTHRNVSGVCDRPELIERFESIASTLKQTSGMDGILVNLQLVPDAVACLVYPLNNTEDFENGIYMDNSGAVGHDLLSDPARKYIAETTLASNKLVVAGPLSLKQCQDCDPTVEKAFIARLPIESLIDYDDETDNMDNAGRKYGKWGFAVALINWNRLVEDSGIYDNFIDGDLEFQLTRTDKVETTQGRFEDKVVILAESRNYNQSLDDLQVQLALPTTNNEWEISIAYCTSGNCVGWFPWAVTVSVVLSLFISVLVYTIFIQKIRHSDAIAEKSRMMIESAERSARNERELNDFIAQ
jgi:hypothetical protein